MEESHCCEKEENRCDENIYSDERRLGDGKKGDRDCHVKKKTKKRYARCRGWALENREESSYELKKEKPVPILHCSIEAIEKWGSIRQNMTTIIRY